MSIINEMLNNLAKQRKSLSPTQQMLNDLNPIAIRTWSYQKITLFSLVLILLFLCIFYFSLENKIHPNNTSTISTSAQTSLSETNPLPTKTSYLLPVEIPASNVTPNDATLMPPSESHAATPRPFTNEETARVELEKAVKLGDDDHVRDAIDVLENLLEKYPRFEEAREELAQDLIVLGENAVADSILKEGLKYTPHFPPFVELRAQISLKQNNPSGALRILLAAPPKIKENPEYHAMIAAVYEKLEEPNRAMNIYRQLLQLQPENATWWFGLAVTLEELGKPNAAAQAYKTALSSGDLNPELQAYATSKINTISG